MVAKRRFADRYSRRRRRRLWRIRRIRQMAEKNTYSLRRGLLLALAAEISFGGWQVFGSGRYGLRLIELEEEYQIEWTAGQVYGIRLNPGRLELEFYHREPLESRRDPATTKQ